MKTARFTSFLVIVALAFISLETHAFAPTPDSNPESFNNKGKIMQAYNQAVLQRVMRIYREKMLTGEDKNVFNQRSRLNEGKKDAHVNDQPNDMVREGPMDPYGYSGSYSPASYHRPSARQVYREAAICYYIEQRNDCYTRERLLENLVYADHRHKVSTDFLKTIFWKQPVDTIALVREEQKNRFQNRYADVGAGNQKTIQRKAGDRFTSPYLKLPDEVKDLDL